MNPLSTPDDQRGRSRFSVGVSTVPSIGVLRVSPMTARSGSSAFSRADLSAAAQSCVVSFGPSSTVAGRLAMPSRAGLSWLRTGAEAWALRVSSQPGVSISTARAPSRSARSHWPR